MIATFPHSNKADAARHYARLHSLSATHTILPGHGTIQSPLKPTQHTDPSGTPQKTTTKATPTPPTITSTPSSTPSSKNPTVKALIIGDAYIPDIKTVTNLPGGNRPKECILFQFNIH